jgi:hypothetical protein
VCTSPKAVVIRKVSNFPEDFDQAVEQHTNATQPEQWFYLPAIFFVSIPEDPLGSFLNLRDPAKFPSGEWPKLADFPEIFCFPPKVSGFGGFDFKSFGDFASPGAVPKYQPFFSFFKNRRKIGPLSLSHTRVLSWKHALDVDHWRHTYMRGYMAR